MGPFFQGDGKKIGEKGAIYLAAFKNDALCQANGKRKNAMRKADRLQGVFRLPAAKRPSLSTPEQSAAVDRSGSQGFGRLPPTSSPAGFPVKANPQK